jgi:hypothetical protein
MLREQGVEVAWVQRRLAGLPEPIHRAASEAVPWIVLQAVPGLTQRCKSFIEHLARLEGCLVAGVARFHGLELGELHDLIQHAGGRLPCDLVGVLGLQAHDLLIDRV